MLVKAGNGSYITEHMGVVYIAWPEDNLPMFQYWLVGLRPSDHSALPPGVGFPLGEAARYHQPYLLSEMGSSSPGRSSLLFDKRRADFTQSTTVLDGPPVGLTQDSYVDRPGSASRDRARVPRVKTCAMISWEDPVRGIRIVSAPIAFEVDCSYAFFTSERDAVCPLCGTKIANAPMQRVGLRIFCFKRLGAARHIFCATSTSVSARGMTRYAIFDEGLRGPDTRNLEDQPFTAVLRSPFGLQMIGHDTARVITSVDGAVRLNELSDVGEIWEPVDPRVRREERLFPSRFRSEYQGEVVVFLLPVPPSTGGKTLKQWVAEQWEDSRYRLRSSIPDQRILKLVKSGPSMLSLSFNEGTIN